LTILILNNRYGTAETGIPVITGEKEAIIATSTNSIAVGDYALATLD
jgi:hypothetical protein